MMTLKDLDEMKNIMIIKVTKSTDKEYQKKLDKLLKKLKEQEVNKPYTPNSNGN